MAGGFIISCQCKTTTQFILTSISRASLTPNFRNYPSLASLNRRRISLSGRLLCSCSSSTTYEPIDISKYREGFSKRMAMAGLKPHHRIALGVSGGPDSMALCVLAADWKVDDLNSAAKASSEFIDGILAIIVDHGLRTESAEEAKTVSRRVLNMGIRCEIASCEWSSGKPKQGHLQEAARTVRYKHFQDVCNQHQIGVLLVAHHADDQAELFILRLSRNSGVLGLAGMAFTSQLFDTYPEFEGVASNSILLARPLLDFSKDDMYNICRGSNQEWVEDPTNQNQLFARNRIRLSLKNLASSTFMPELDSVISACRRTRIYVDQICRSLLNQAVTIMPQGHAVIDLEILNPLKIEDICLSKFATMLLQFISQKHRPVRGSALKLVLDYIRIYPCKASLTAAGCYLCAAPGTKGTKVLVCCSVNCSLPLEMELFYRRSNEVQKSNILSNEVEKIVEDGKSYLDDMVLDSTVVHFLEATSSESVLMEAKNLNMISESTYKTILSLQASEIERFKSKIDIVPEIELKNEVKYVATSMGNALHPDQIGYFMNRFLIMWKLSKNLPSNANSLDKAVHGQDLGEEMQQYNCKSCLVSHDLVLEVRHMIDADWLYLAELLKCCDAKDFQHQLLLLAKKMGKETGWEDACSQYIKLSAQRALLSLKSIPVATRRSLPVLVNSQGLLISIPSVGFKHCPCFEVSAIWKPRIPLGGGHSSFI